VKVIARSHRHNGAAMASLQGEVSSTRMGRWAIHALDSCEGIQSHSELRGAEPMKHVFKPSEDDRDTCEHCGNNFRA